jgi:hypothetical protein
VPAVSSAFILLECPDKCPTYCNVSEFRRNIVVEAAYANNFVSGDNEAILNENQFGEGGMQR